MRLPNERSRLLYCQAHTAWALGIVRVSMDPERCRIRQQFTLKRRAFSLSF